MTVREIIVEIKYLVRQGVSKTDIARQCGVSRQTVYNLLSRDELGPRRRGPRASKLDLFKAYIRTRLEKFDLPATSLLRELRSRGYGGGLTILRQYMAPLKAEYTRRVTERFETVPGQQAQIDWGECGTVEVDGQRRKLYVFVMVLGYSRMMYARFTTSTRLPELLACLVRGFDRLGIPRVATSNSPTCGRVKLPHRPRRRTGWKLMRGASFGSPCGGLLQSPALALEA